MFGKVAADVLGISDVGSVIKPENYDKVDTDDYVLHEDGEKIFFLIKSKSDEYCFTNKALIHLDGTSATSKKRMLHRYDYHAHKIANVMLETAGSMIWMLRSSLPWVPNNIQSMCTKSILRNLRIYTKRW